MQNIEAHCGRTRKQSRKSVQNAELEHSMYNQGTMNLKPVKQLSKSKVILTSCLCLVLLGAFIFLSKLFSPAPIRSGVIDRSGKVIFAERGVCSRYNFSSGMLRLHLPETSDVCFVDVHGQNTFGKTFQQAEDFAEGLAAVQDRELDKWGFIDLQGRFVIPPQFQDASSFSNGLAPAQSKNLWGFIDKHGTWIVEPKFANALPFTDGRAAVQVNGKIGFIDVNGEFKVKPLYDEASCFSEGLSYVVTIDKSTNNRIVNYIDVYGETKIALNEVLSKLTGRKIETFNNYLELYQNTDEYLMAAPPNKYLIGTTESRHRRGSIFKYGKLLDVRSSDGLIRVNYDRKYGYIDTTGRPVIPMQLSASSAFNEGLACVQVGECPVDWLSRPGEDFGVRFGFIDRSGKFVIPATYESARSFSEGLAKCTKSKKNVFIDQSGKLVIELPDSLGYVGDFHEGYATLEPGVGMKWVK